MDFPWQAATAAGGGWALAFMCGYLVFRGRLVPRSTMDDVIHDRNEWRAESRIKDQQLSEKDTQLRHLSEVGETQKAVLTTLRDLAPKGESL